MKQNIFPDANVCHTYRCYFSKICTVCAKFELFPFKKLIEIFGKFCGSFHKLDKKHVLLVPCYVSAKRSILVYHLKALTDYLGGGSRVDSIVRTGKLEARMIFYLILTGLHHKINKKPLDTAI